MNPTVRYAVFSFVASLAILFAKAAAWWVTGSAVLLADAVESALDVVTASILVLSVRYSTRPPDEGHPWGHGKIEYFSSGFQGALILGVGISLGMEGIGRLMNTEVPTRLGDGLLLSAAATLANLLLSATLIRAGRRLRSPALEADGHHNLADVATTLGGWLGLGLGWITGVWLLDPVVALLVAAQIVWTGFGLLRRAVGGLMDATLEPERLEKLRDAMCTALKRDPQARMARLRARESSHQVFVDCIVELPGDRSVTEAHALCDAMEEAARNAEPGCEVHVHVEPLPDQNHRQPESNRRTGTTMA